MENADGREDLMDLDEPPPLSPLIDERFRRLEEVTLFRRLDQLSLRPKLHPRSQTQTPPPIPHYSHNPLHPPNPFFQFGQGSVSVSPDERRKPNICRSRNGRNADLLARALNNTEDVEPQFAETNLGTYGEKSSVYLVEAFKSMNVDLEVKEEEATLLKNGDMGHDVVNCFMNSLLI